MCDHFGHQIMANPKLKKKRPVTALIKIQNVLEQVSSEQEGLRQPCFGLLWL